MSKKTKPINTENGISELKELKLGDEKQMLLIRGEDKKNPILLFLHGGPGTPNIGWVSNSLKQLEKYFVVVNWDQLGAGLSYKKNIDHKDITLDKLLEYTHELVIYLTKRFSRKSIYLIGHSWGSFLGINYIACHPKYIKKNISISPFIGGNKSEAISYEYCLSEARKANHKRAIKQLEYLGPPPYKNWLRGLKIRINWTNAFHGSIKDKKQTNLNYFANVPEYKFTDMIRYIKGIKFSLECLWPESMKRDLLSCPVKLTVPTIFLLGRFDQVAPTAIAEEFIHNIDTTDKKIIWFEHSAHMCYLEEKEKFITVIQSLCTDG